MVRVLCHPNLGQPFAEVWAWETQAMHDRIWFGQVKGPLQTQNKGRGTYGFNKEAEKLRRTDKDYRLVGELTEAQLDELPALVRAAAANNPLPTNDPDLISVFNEIRRARNEPVVQVPPTKAATAAPRSRPAAPKKGKWMGNQVLSAAAKANVASSPDDDAMYF